jgi:hypothetical protein
LEKNVHHPQGLDYEVRVNRHAPNPADMRVTDVKGTVMPGLQKVKEGYLARTRECGEERLSLQEKLDQIEERIADLRDENK